MLMFLDNSEIVRIVFEKNHSTTNKMYLLMWLAILD